MLKQALILTSHRDYAQAMRAGLLTLGDERTQVDVELDALRAMQLVPRQYGLILIDMLLNAMDGLQLLLLLKQQAPASKFVIVGDVDNETFRAQAARSGADLFLRRPDGPAALREALAALAELIASVAAEGASAGDEDGPVARIGDVVERHAGAGDSVLLQVRHERRTGDIFIQEGEVVHAQCPGKSGRAALDEMLAWNDGSARIKALKIDYVPPRTIELSLRELLATFRSGASRPDLRGPGGGQLFTVSSERPFDAASTEVLLEAPPRVAEAAPVSATQSLLIDVADGGTPLPPLNAHWKVNLMGELVEGSQVSEADRCAFITYFIYRKLADVAVALEVEYFNEMTLWGTHLQQVLVADNLGVRHAVFETARTDESQRDQYILWCREQSF
jgi:CheY-like chemotaxis protein